MQDRFFNVFESKGMTPKIALEAITKYAELIARNGTRFADSFARAAADAKKIGVDLNKVSQIGDNIIDNFEGFLESQAELGAMGFGFDSNRLAEIAETGSDADLFNELRSQLAATGKDITKLRRSERLALESAYGINLSDMMKLAGLTPGGEKTQEEYAAEGNSLLAQIVTAMAIMGPILSAVSIAMTGISAAFKTGSVLLDALKPLSGLLFTGPGKALLVAFSLAALGAWWAAGETEKRTKRVDQAEKDMDSASKEGNLDKFKNAFSDFLNNNFIKRMLLTGPEIGGYVNLPSAEEAAKIHEYQRRLNDLEIKNRELYLKHLNDSYGGMFPGRYTGPNIFNQLPPSTQRPTVGPVKKAAGGSVTGPGTGTSDSIPAMLSNGEYVLPANTVSKIGVSNLDKLRSLVNSSDYGKLITALLSGNLKDAAKPAKAVLGEEMMEFIVKRVFGISTIGSIGTVAAGKEVYNTYQANKDKPYPTWWSATAPGEVVVNGWSPSKRNNPYANSGTVVTVDEQDFAKYGYTGPLAGMYYQQAIEQKAFVMGGGLLQAPAQRMIDFVNQQVSNSLPTCSYLPGIVSSSLQETLPKEIATALKIALKDFGKKMKGYYTNEAVLVATESRTSSPVRIPRDKTTLEHIQIKGLYPCAEGAGYAGGIVSAAIDGMTCAHQIALKITS
jgi:hypothetical protein